MTDNQLILKLAKVIIAAAWADGEIDEKEINNLKRMLLHLRQTSTGRGVELTGQEWAQLDMYIETPVGDEERARLVADLSGALRTREEKQFVVQAVQDLIAADGAISDEERAVLAEVEAALDEASTGSFGRLRRLFGSENGSPKATSAPNRELFFDDFLRNKVYYNLAQRMRTGELDLNLSEAEQRKLGLAGGLMARVAHVDGEVSQDEFQNMMQAIQRHWSIGDDEAAFVVQTALSTVDETYDTVRMMHELAISATPQERQQFLAALFALAAADGQLSIQEHEEIRFIARGIDLGHEEFIAAKLQVVGS